MTSNSETVLCGFGFSKCVGIIEHQYLHHRGSIQKANEGSKEKPYGVELGLIPRI